MWWWTWASALNIIKKKSRSNTRKIIPLIQPFHGIFKNKTKTLVSLILTFFFNYSPKREFDKLDPNNIHFFSITFVTNHSNINHVYSNTILLKIILTKSC